MNNNYLKLVRRLKLWVIILAILNISIISTIGVNMYLAKQKEAMVNSGADGINNFFVNYLELSSSQKEQFDAIFASYNMSRKEVGVLLRSVKERLSVPEVEKDTVVMNAIYRDFITAHSINRDLAERLYDSIRAICSPTQVAKFNDVISKTVITNNTNTQANLEIE